MARRRKDIDLPLVRKLAGCGLTVEQIAAVAQVADRTIQRRCAKELRLGRLEGEGKLQAKMWQVALAGNVNMMIFLAKNRLGMTDRPDVIVNVQQNSAGPPQFNAAQFKERFVAAQKYIEDHRDELERPRSDGNGEVPRV
jgi:hypothetical protein